MAEPTLPQQTRVYRITYWRESDYVERTCDVRAWTAADALTQFGVEHCHVRVRTIVPVEPETPDGARVREADHG